MANLRRVNTVDAVGALKFLFGAVISYINS